MSTVTLPSQSSTNRNRTYQPGPPRNQALNYREVGTYHKPLVATTKMYRLFFIDFPRKCYSFLWQQD